MPRPKNQNPSAYTSMRVYLADYNEFMDRRAGRENAADIFRRLMRDQNWGGHQSTLVNQEPVNQEPVIVKDLEEAVEAALEAAHIEASDGGPLVEVVEITLPIEYAGYMV